MYNTIFFFDPMVIVKCIFLNFQVAKNSVFYFLILLGSSKKLCPVNFLLLIICGKYISVLVNIYPQKCTFST